MVYAQSFSSRPPPTTSYVPSQERSESADFGDASFWNTTPERLEYRAGQEDTPRKRGFFGRIARFVTTGIAAVALAGSLALARPAEPVTHTPQSIEYAQPLEERADTYRAGVDGPNSLWRIAEDYLKGSLPTEQPARDRALIDATDELAQKNGLCPPSAWHVEHPRGGYQDRLDCEDGSASPHILEWGQEISTRSLEERISAPVEPVADSQARAPESTYEASDEASERPFDPSEFEFDRSFLGHHEPLYGPVERPADYQAPQERSSVPIPSPREPSDESIHRYLVLPPSDVPPLKGLPDHAVSGIDDTDESDHDEVADVPPGPSDSLEGRVDSDERDSRRTSTADWTFGGISAAVLAAAGAAGWYFSRKGGEAHRLDREMADPQRGLDDTPQGNATLAFGHAYLARKNYLDRTSDDPTQGRRLSGAARTCMERKAARLNRLASMLDTPYVSVSDDRSIADHVRESLGIEALTDRTARSYVAELAGLGHKNARAYVDQMPANGEEPEGEETPEQTPPEPQDTPPGGPHRPNAPRHV